METTSNVTSLHEPGYHRLTEFGKRHGGSGAAYIWMMLVGAIAKLGALGLAIWVGNTNLETMTKANIVIGWLFFMFAIIIVIMYLYLKPRHATKLLLATIGIALICVLILAGLITLLVTLFA